MPATYNICGFSCVRQTDGRWRWVGRWTLWQPQSSSGPTSVRTRIFYFSASVFTVNPNIRPQSANSLQQVSVMSMTCSFTSSSPSFFNINSSGFLQQILLSGAKAALDIKQMPQWANLRGINSSRTGRGMKTMLEAEQRHEDLRRVRQKNLLRGQFLCL